MTPLPAGTRLGAYEISAAIGAGGMGEVYRAKDTRLGREVAIKVLPAAFALDPERLARFEREARLLASLNHPNIAHIYSFERLPAAADGSRPRSDASDKDRPRGSESPVGEQDVAPASAQGLPREAPIAFLVMEFVEGEDLSQRLKGGAIPQGEAMLVAKQIAEALEEAHEKTIVHRDLKPANIKLTPDGRVKVLDFGLARAYAADSTSGSAPEISHSPTMTRQGTEAGMILGTAAYMSPEQARGKALDKRADIWAFGVVLYEMLTGTRLFTGETVSDLLAAVLRAEVDWSALPQSTPAELRRLLGRCLARDPKNRLHDIADARIALDETLRGGNEPPAAVERSRPRSSPWSGLPWVVAAGAVIVAIGLGLRNGERAVSTPPLTTFGIQTPPQHLLTRSQLPILDLSNDGRTLLFVAEGEHASSIFRRTFDRMAVTRIAGTEGAENPGLSPDGRWIAFFAGGQLRKISVEGGTSVVVAGALAPRGLSWSRDGSIFFSPLYTGGILRVSGAGGDPVAVTSVAKGERSHRWPQVLPDGRTVIFTVGMQDSPGEYDASNIEAQRLDTGERRTILKGARMARYTALGYLVFQRGQTLLAVKFDARRLVVEGQPFTIQEGVGSDPSSGASYFSVSDDGVVVVAPETSIPATRLLVLVDKAGGETALNAPPASFFHPRISPDGRRLAFAIGTGSASDDDIYTLEIASQRMQRLTFGQGHGFPLWSPDGKRILFTNGRTGQTGIGMKAADGSGEDITLLKRSEFQLTDSWHPDGRRLAITDATRSIDIRIFDTAPGGEVTPLFANPSAGESAAAFSPDGRYIAYQTTETGTDEVVVETFPPGGGKWQISVAGGITPVWARDGRALYFVTGQSLMAMDVDTRGVFRPGTPRVLFTGPYDLHTVIQRNFDVGPDGRFAMVKRQVSSSSPGEILVVGGWSSLDPSRTGSMPR